MAEVMFEHIEKRYVGRAAVADLTLRIPSGELVCLLGPSGCGKTTTLRMLAGFLTPDSGDIRIGGRSVLNAGPERRPTAMVFQRYTLWPHMNVFHNVAFGLKLRRLSPEVVRRKVQDALTLVGLPGMEARQPAQLSGGQQQRVALARALVLEPQVLLLDEPLSSLDAKLRVGLRNEIRGIVQALGITTVFVTHDQEEAMAVADRIAVMHEGVLHQVQSPGELYDRPATRFVADFIGQMNFLPLRRGAAGQLLAGPLAFGVAEVVGSGAAGSGVASSTELAVRPEDVLFGETGHPVQVLRVSDLGHYREVVFRLDGAPDLTPLTAFVGKTETLHTPRVRVRRALAYADGRLLGDAVPLSASVVNS
ncbi:ABC transporter ATP-binding protein [Deinococcus sp.]|uniref:ABC transporter ATP-binding protein n=1 Tax=Deinococcus sp. TaxID=47478 RepID=UPI003C7DF5F8